jgi:hypothetical protein
MMSLPQGRTDRRKIMVSHSLVFTLLFLGPPQKFFVATSIRLQSTVYALFRGEATEHDLALAGHSGRYAQIVLVPYVAERDSKSIS